ncbi:MAG TPA: hypothetical protein VGN02_12360 [Paenibacillus sp.]|jgi:hypothetical protein
MSNKRKPPTLQQKKDEVNKKALIWAGSVTGVLILFVIIVLLLTKL